MFTALRTALVVAHLWLLIPSGTQAADSKEILKDTPFEEVLARAKAGEAAAQLWLGKAYSFQFIGVKVQMNLPESFRWYLAAATNGIAEAQCRVGRSYYSESASNYGNKPADVAKRKQSANAAMQWLMKAALQGEVNAYQELGNGFRDGKVFAKDEVEAYKWFHLAAENKHAAAEYDRNALSSKLTPAQIEGAKQRAVQFLKAQAAARAN